MSNKKIVTVVSIASMTLLLQGCPTMQEVREQHQKKVNQQNTDLVQRSQDPQLASAFYPNPFGKGFSVNVLLDSIVVGHPTFPSGSVKEQIDRVSRIDTTTDAVSQHYIQTVKNRGNIVKLYKSGLNEKIGLMFGKSNMYYAEIEKQNLTPCMIEYDKNGRIVSAMIRGHAFAKNFVNYDHYEMAYIYFGATARRVENSIDNRAFEAGYITTL